MSNPLTSTDVNAAEAAALPARAFEEFTIHVLDPAGIAVVVPHQGSPFTTQGRTYFRGDTLTVTGELVAANSDAAGRSWLLLDADGQRETWNRVRFGRGDLPEHIADDLREERRRRLLQERSSILRTNPHLAKRSGGSALLDRIDSELSGL